MREGVMVAVEVGQETSEAVTLGAVEVGKAHKSAWQVGTRAVPVRRAILCAAAASGGRLDNHKYIARSNHSGKDRHTKPANGLDFLFRQRTGMGYGVGSIV